MEIFKYFIYYMSSNVSEIQRLGQMNEYFNSLKVEDFINNESNKKKHEIALDMSKPPNYTINRIFNNPPIDIQPINGPIETDIQKLIPKKKDVFEFINTSRTFMVREISFAFMLIAAFAWHDTIKFYIARNIKFNKGYTHYYLYYALTVSFATVLIITISNKFFNTDTHV